MSKPRATSEAAIFNMYDLRRRRRDLQRSGLFDEKWYLAKYSDVRGSGYRAMDHFLRIGSKEGRSPGPSFDTSRYLAQYQDVAQSSIEPWRHYYLHGRAENRQPGVDSDLFDLMNEMNALPGVRQIVSKLRELELRVDQLQSTDLLERLAKLERISAQWKASVPLILRKLEDATRPGENDARIRDLEKSVKALLQASDE